MHFLPFDNFSFTTSLGAEEVNARIRKIAGPWVLYRLPSIIDPDQKPYEGELTSNSFEIYKLNFLRSDFNPVIMGKYEALTTGTRIDVNIRLRWWSLFLLVLFIGVCAFFQVLQIIEKNALARIRLDNFIPGIFGLAAYVIAMAYFNTQAIHAKLDLAKLLENEKAKPMTQ
jgi:hypothetical protein